MALWSNEDRWRPLYEKAAAETGVEAALLMGITGAESAFDPRSFRQEPALYTGPGASPGEHVASWGLMQSTQEAAVAGGWPKGWPFSRLLEPELSITYGAREIQRYLANPDQNLTAVTRPMAVHVNGTADAVAAYNAGFPRSIRFTTAYIAKLFAYPYPDYKNKPPADWHYANEPYVRRVLTYAEYFRAKLAGRAETAAAVAADIKKHTYHPVAAGAGIAVLLLILAGGAWAWARSR